jgi:hypothetical protein
LRRPVGSSHRPPRERRFSSICSHTYHTPQECAYPIW